MVKVITVTNISVFQLALTEGESSVVGSFRQGLRKSIYQ